jgi:hypothetical protein
MDLSLEFPKIDFNSTLIKLMRRICADIVGIWVLDRWAMCILYSTRMTRMRRICTDLYWALRLKKSGQPSDLRGFAVLKVSCR